MQELTIFTSFKDVQINRRSKTMNPKQNLDKPFDCLNPLLHSHLTIYMSLPFGTLVQ